MNPTVTSLRLCKALRVSFLLWLVAISSLPWERNATAQSTTITIGETTVLGGNDGGNGNLLLVQDTTLSQTATIQSLSFYVTSAAGSLRLGVYDATGPGGGPGALKAQTNAFTPVVGWNTANVITPVSLAPGVYWLAYFPSSNSLSFAVTFSTGSYKFANLTFGSMPATFPAIASQGTTHWSLYATLITGPPVPDIAPPTVAISAPASGAVVSGTSTAVSAGASDNVGVVGVQFLLDGQNLGTEDTASPYSVAWNTTLAANGSHILSARARDAAGNTATSSVPVSVDNQAPTGTVTINNGAAATNNRNVTLMLSATDAISAVTQMRFSNTGTSFNTAVAFAPTSPWTLTSGAGTKTVYAQFKDAVGNWSATVSDTIVLDTTAPTISALAASNITSSSATISWITNEPATSQADYGLTTSYGATTILDGALVTVHSHIISGLSPATTYNYRVRSRDAASNERVGSNSTFTTITAPDTTAPSVPANLSAAPISPAQINLTWTSSTDNVAVTGYKVFRDGNQVATTSVASFSNTGLTPDTFYTYAVSAFDAAGNVSGLSATASASTLPLPPADTTAPVVGITSPTASAVVSGTVAITADATDNVGVAGVQFLLDGGNLGPEDVAFPYSVLWDTSASADGLHIISARARDAAGNAATSSSVSVSVSNGSAVPVTMGETTVFAGNDGGNGNLLMVQDATLAQTATVQSISFYVTQASGTLRLGVYDATGSGGDPGSLLAETNLFTPVIGWNTVSVITPVLLPAGPYWLAYNPSSNDLQFATNHSIGAFRGASFASGPDLPATFPSITLQGTTHWSLYATLSSGSVSDTTPPTVSITSPGPNAPVSNIVLVTADAGDNVGVLGVQFFVDGVATGLEDRQAPYALQWDTRTSINGAHTLTARARDFSGNQKDSNAVTVNVANTNFFQNEVLATGFNLPTNIEFLPDGRMLVAELLGTIKVLPPPYTTPDATPFLQLNLNFGGYQQGIFDIALDPNFTTNHFYYVFYTKDVPNRDRLSRFTADATLTGTIPGSEVILYQDPQVPNEEHHGGAVNFGNDGKIYFTTGEHFNAANAQNLTNPRGKIHRINPDGTIPTDNPFYDGAGPNWDSIWALGLRNPFRAYYDAPTDRLFVADVGGNDYSTAYEEVDLGKRGANYGWPNCEVGTCGNSAYSAAIYAYPHLGRDAAITGGFVYHGTQFPPAYQGTYFFADYTQNWIKGLTFDGQGNVTGVFNFEPPDGANDGPYGDIVYLTEGPDGALYYVDLGYADVGGTSGISKIRRIRYTQSNLPPTALASATPTSGPAPLTVNFSSAGSSDPEGQAITYFWTFGDGATSTGQNPVHVYVQAGSYSARLSVSDGTNTTLGTPFTISVGSAPTPTILTPQNGAFFIAGDTISFSGAATDADDGILPASAYLWNIDFLHEGHVHPGLVLSGATNGTFSIPTSGHDFSGNTRYRIMLTVTDSNGLQSTTSVTVYPKKVNLSFDTVPTGLTVYLDGIAKVAPFVYDTLVNFTHTVEARNQSTSSATYTFQSWSDGGAQLHTITVPSIAQPYTATFTTSTTTTINIGETTVLGGNDGGNGNLLLVQDTTLSQTATIQSLSFYVTSAAGSLRLGVYDATGPGGGPGALKAQTNAFTPVVGWNTANVITPVSLAPGVYWLAYFPSSNSLSFAVTFSAGTYKFANLAFGPMPATFPAIASQGTTHWSLYATLLTR